MVVILSNPSGGVNFVICCTNQPNLSRVMVILEYLFRKTLKKSTDCNFNAPSVPTAGDTVFFLVGPNTRE